MWAGGLTDLGRERSSGVGELLIGARVGVEVECWVIEHRDQMPDRAVDSLPALRIAGLATGPQLLGRVPARRVDAARPGLTSLACALAAGGRGLGRAVGQDRKALWEPAQRLEGLPEALGGDHVRAVRRALVLTLALGLAVSQVAEDQQTGADRREQQRDGDQHGAVDQHYRCLRELRLCLW